ncbi:tRNA G46 methylase TrmB [Fibrobacter sp. UWT2]|uniref:methyltransferase domain-containing protein n=1 Tax=Fibrobacter sp. UWT2 TaxID=1896224 RepID=UPI00091CACB1|nr:methyltransferase domain-containing protein [Fibrobacter sp. UWT2]SHK61845.1 tRNA G46 methylase TrmB [Fibrobacter sp. UWT2]
MTARSVTSNQIDLYKNLEAVVRKYAATTFLRPVADHTREAFEQASEFVRTFYGTDVAGCVEVVLDSGCGTGESTLHLAKKFPNVPVIGIDKSAVRLSKAGNERQLEVSAGGSCDVPANAFWVRAELLDFWRLALEKVNAGEWKILHHALYYPNPWPKESEATRRFHLHPIFPTLLRLSPVTELRTNWEIYAREFAEAARVLGDAFSLKFDVELGAFEPQNPETAFERKYKEARQQLWRTLVKT